MIMVPCGKTFPSKKAATKHYQDGLRAVTAEAATKDNNNTADNKKKRKTKIEKEKEEQDVGDPPSRLEGHDLIGRKVVWTFSTSLPDDDKSRSNKRRPYMGTLTNLTPIRYVSCRALVTSIDPHCRTLHRMKTDIATTTPTTTTTTTTTTTIFECDRQ